MAITASQLLSEIQGDLIEDVNNGTSWSSGHWTATEVYGYLTRRFQQFLKDSLIVTTRATQATVPNVQAQDLPDDWIVGLRVAWRPYTASSTTFTDLPRADAWEVDDAAPTSSYTMSTPKLYTEGEVPPPRLELWPPPDVVGELELLSISMPTGWDPSANPTFSPLPDEFVTYVKYGVMADMLSKQGRGQDVQRAGYCEARYSEGVEIAKLLLQQGF